MRKYAVVLLAVVLFIFASVISVFSNDIVWDDISRGNLNLRSVLVNPDNPHIIYIGSTNAVLKSEDGGATWRNILSVRGANTGVNFLSFACADTNSLYAATGNGLYVSRNEGRNWEKIFKGKNYLENECTTLAVLPDALYLGTKGGLLVSKDKGRSWHKESLGLSSSQILAIAYSPKEPNYIYLACAEGVFKFQDSGQSWEKTFVASAAENSNETQEINEDEDEEEKSPDLRYINIDPNNANCLYLATSRGVYISQDKGGNWESLSSFGLLNREVRFLSISSQSRLYAATKSGVFAYLNNRWQELSLGLIAQDIKSLALDNQDNLYAACDTGLFKTKVERDTKGRDDLSAIYYKDEPAISEVQQAAVKYAEVEPEKILRWRKQAAKKALLPQVSIGIDRNTTDLWHWESGSTAIGQSGDDLLRRGRDSTDWDVTLSWNLGELIWNDDQTSIDVRSRLMVQLRGDVLDEVTKLYFERIRVKMELDNLSIEDRKKRFEKELKLQELTAQIDGLTGGYFSSQIK